MHSESRCWEPAQVHIALVLGFARNGKEYLHTENEHLHKIDAAEISHSHLISILDQ